MAVTQKNRKIQVFTPLADDALLFYQMQGRECLSEPFEYNLDLLSENPAIDPAKLLGKNICVALEMADGKWRYFNGCATRFGQHENINVFSHYRVTVRPWLWFLTRASNCRIFQNKTAPDIIKQVFRDQGFSDFKEKLSGSYATREYCVQYRETDFKFVSRLMEDEGICYYFTHEKDKHYLVLADSGNAHDKFPGYEKIPYHVDIGHTDRSRKDHVRDWAFAHEVQPGAYEITDYDFKKPKANLLVKSQLKESHAHADHEFFDYPGGYTETGAGDNFVRQRIEEQHARFERCEGQCNARGLAVGYRFNLEEFPRKDQNREYLVVSATYRLLLDEYFSSSSGDEEKLFDCSFTVQDHKRPYRPPRVTPKPLVHGAQTAVVVGPSGEEIHTDKYGRVKVQFHWDRYGKKDQDSSCWVRVAHPWAGKNWGMVAIPRMGHEVVIEFLEGDPDQPLIVGSVYNADNMPPYALPANATQTGILTRSSKGGSAANCNEFRFEDKKGSEQVYLHAEKNQDIEVESDETHWVGHDRSKTVDNDETVNIGKNRTETVGSNETISIGNNRNESVGANESISVGANQSIAIGANREEAVGANEAVAIGKDRSHSVGENEKINIGKNHTIEVGETRETQIGKDDKSQVGKKFYLEAGDEITLKTGDSSITMKKDGTIQIKGKDITIIGSGKIGIKASGDMVLKGSKIAEN
ncbi:MAG: type VI secretion system Vgr family protein [Methylomonas sp.]